MTPSKTGNFDFRKGLCNMKLLKNAYMFLWIAAVTLYACLFIREGDERDD